MLPLEARSASSRKDITPLRALKAYTVTMLQKELAAGDLLFHAVHGVCRVDTIVNENHSGKEVRCYSLVPKVASRMKVRFVVSVVDVQASGFHAPVSLKEAREILDYLKAGVLTAAPRQDEAWALARAILSSQCDKPELKDAKKRQMLERSAKGLVSELAFVFKMTLKDVAASVQRSLGNVSEISPMILAALAHAASD